MNEKEFEDILCKYPEFIEDDLSLQGRQVNIKGKHVDLLFRDKYNLTLIVELKRGVVERKNVAQLLDYEGYFVTADNPDVRVMLIGNRVPPNLKKSLEHHGFEWRELPETTLKKALQDKKDSKFLSYFDDFDKDYNIEQQQTAINNKISKGLGVKMTMIEKYIFVFSKPDHRKKEYSKRDIVRLIKKEFPETKEGTILPSDCCYNIFSLGGISFVKREGGVLKPDNRSRLFKKTDAGYIFLGPDFPYTGELTYKGKRCGMWKDGKCTLDNWLIQEVINKS